jgi:hypothetical protein
MVTSYMVIDDGPTYCSGLAGAAWLFARASLGIEEERGMQGYMCV